MLNKKNSYPPEIFKTVAEIAGITINGDHLWDVAVHDSDVYQRVLTQGELGLGEAYMDGLWDCPALDQFFDRLFRIEDIAKKFSGRLWFRLAFSVVYYRLRSLQNRMRTDRIHDQHYTIGNDVFEAMLDPTMSYSCAYWENADTLEQAQLDKLEMTCQKLELKRGERLLDIGCGWGGLAEYAAKHYGVEVVGATISEEQQRLATERCQGLPVEIKAIDYQNISGKFDKIVSIDMIEHIHLKKYRTYFQKVSSMLENNGLFLLHTIGSHTTSRQTDKWSDKYIFTSFKVPSCTEVTQSVDGVFLIEDLHNFGWDYDRTLMAWAERFDQNWHTLTHSYDSRFYRMWKYYLLICAGSFRSRQVQLWQLVFSNRTRRQIYRSKRNFTIAS